MRLKRHRPDLILMLAIVVGIGVIITMMAQAGEVSSEEASAVFDGKSVYQTAWIKIQQADK